MALPPSRSLKKNPMDFNVRKFQIDQLVQEQSVRISSLFKTSDLSAKSSINKIDIEKWLAIKNPLQMGIKDCLFIFPV